MLIRTALLGAAAVAYAPLVVIIHGGASGGDALVLPHGDILNVRNIQGGIPSDPNLDIGAGSATHRGTLSLNYDVGRRVLIYDGHRHLLARFDSRGVRFFRRR